MNFWKIKQLGLVQICEIKLQGLSFSQYLN